MEQFVNEMGGKGIAPIATPYLLIDVDDNCRIFVTEWANNANEQWGNQFIDGQVDVRILPKLAKVLATVHTTSEYDRNLNHGVEDSWEEVKRIIRAGHTKFLLPHDDSSNNNKQEAPEPSSSSFSSVVEEEEEGKKEEEEPSKVVKQQQEQKYDDAFIKFVMEELGQDRYLQILDAADSAALRKDCLIHGDAHCFNMLVEAKPYPTNLQPIFGTNGTFYICDWEMCRPGPIGRDMGTFQCFPIISSMFHSAQGHYDDVAKHLTDTTLENVWELYLDEMKEQSTERRMSRKSESEAESDVVDDDDDDDHHHTDDLARIYRDALGWTGYFMMIFYSFNVHMEFYNKDGLSDETIDKIRSRVAMLGLRLMEMSFLLLPNNEGKEKNQQQSRHKNNENNSKNEESAMQVDPMKEWPNDLNSLNDLRQWSHSLIEQYQKMFFEESQENKEEEIATIVTDGGVDAVATTTPSPEEEKEENGRSTWNNKRNEQRRRQRRGSSSTKRLSSQQPPVKRRSSLLRASGRRVSDASIIVDATIFQQTSSTTSEIGK